VIFFGGFFSRTVGARERRRLWTAGILYSQLLGMASLIAAGVCYLPRIDICIKSFFNRRWTGFTQIKRMGLRIFLSSICVNPVHLRLNFSVFMG